MRKALFLIFILLISGGWFKHGNSAAAVTCTFTTGVCVGIGGGSLLFTAGTCNGVADDSVAFASFNSWARATWQASFSGQIQLNLPSTTCKIASSTVQCDVDPNFKCPFIGIKNLKISGVGTLSIAATQLNSFAGQGQFQDNVHSSRTESANAGDSCVNLTTPAEVSRFISTAPVLMTGIDLQGITGTPQGYPTNPQFWDYLHVASTSASLKCDGITSGASVRFTTSLTNQYLSTWPLYNSGNSGAVDGGGPATLYALSTTWDTTVEFVGITINYPSGAQIYAQGDTVIYRNTTFPGSCAIPTQNRSWQAYNSNFASCGGIEIDKIIDEMVTSGLSTSSFNTQSTGVKLWTDTGSTFTQLQGSPLVFVGNGTTFSSVLKPGATGQGRSNSFSCTNCVVASFTQGGVTDDGLSHGVQNTYSMNSGTITIPNGSRFTSVQSNGGAAQLVLASTAQFTTGKYVQLGGTYSGVWQITVDSSTTMTLIGSTFTTTNASWICAAGLSCGARWAAPGNNIYFSGTNGIEKIGQITTLTQDVNFTYIGTTGLGSSFPADVTVIGLHPSPKFNCPGCTGAAVQIASLAQAPIDAPLYSYQTFTFPWTIGTATQSTFIIWGALAQLNINVTVASSTAAPFHLSSFDNWPVYSSGVTATYGPIVASNTSGNRQISSTGVVTCNGSAGACVGGDSLSTPSALWFGKASSSGPNFSTAPSVGASVTLTIQTNQGVVNP